MGTIADKLEYLGETKNLIKEAIAEKGVDMSDEPVFRDYPMRIGEISGGGGGGLMPTPEEFYRQTRPGDWLPMTADDEFPNNRIELLFHITNGVTELLAFTVGTSSGQYKVLFNGVVQGSYNSGSTCSFSLSSSDFGDLTSDGFKQVMVSIEPASEGANITSFASGEHPAKPGVRNWNIVEMKLRCEELTSLGIGGSIHYLTLCNLRYFTGIGTNKITSASYLFYYLYSLVAIFGVDLSKVTNVDTAIRGCPSLQYVSGLDLRSVTSVGFSATQNICYLFGDCPSLRYVSGLDLRSATSVKYLFYSHAPLSATSGIDLSKLTDASYLFNSCSSLQYVSGLDLRSATNMTLLFDNCYSLKYLLDFDLSSNPSGSSMLSTNTSLSRLTFKPITTSWAGFDIQVGSPYISDTCLLSHDALVELFESLPTPTTTRVLIIAGNPGVSSLTAAEKAIATNKNWVLST
jgi:hypothetical protein